MLDTHHRTVAEMGSSEDEVDGAAAKSVKSTSKEFPYLIDAKDIKPDPDAPTDPTRKYIGNIRHLTAVDGLIWVGVGVVVAVVVREGVCVG